MAKKPKKLAIEFDVTSLGADEIKELELAASAQAEESDGQGGQHYDGTTGHPEVPVLGSSLLRSARQTKLIVLFDTAGLTKSQTDWLSSEVMVQAEDHPGVQARSKIL